MCLLAIVNASILPAALTDAFHVKIFPLDCELDVSPRTPGRAPLPFEPWGSIHNPGLENQTMCLRPILRSRPVMDGNVTQITQSILQLEYDLHRKLDLPLRGGRLDKGTRYPALAQPGVL